MTDQTQKLTNVMKQNHAQQCQFFLNAFWHECKSHGEDIYVYWQKMIDLDKQQFKALCTANKASGDWVQGSLLDEFWSHKFLESLGKPMSIVEFRQEFKKIDQNFDKQMGMIEFLVWKYNLTVAELLARPQGGASAELEKAQQLFQEVEETFKKAQAALDTASAAEAEAKQRQATATKSAEEAQRTANEAAAAAAEQQAAVDALKAQEDAYAQKTKELTAQSETGGVSGMKAKNLLAQHLSEDPLPLRKAKLTAEAAAKKTDKANKVAQAAKEAAENDRQKAEAAANQAEQDRLAAETAVEDGQKAMEAAEKYLEEQKAKGTGKTEGTFWWLDRELAEKKKYMPKSGKAKILM